MWWRFCAGIVDDGCNVHYVRMFEGVIEGALVWYVREFGDNGWDEARQGTCVAAPWMRSRICNELLEGTRTV